MPKRLVISFQLRDTLREAIQRGELEDQEVRDFIMTVSALEVAEAYGCSDVEAQGFLHLIQAMINLNGKIEFSRFSGLLEERR